MLHGLYLLWCGCCSCVCVLLVFFCEMIFELLCAVAWFVFVVFLFVFVCGLMFTCVLV